MDTFFLLIQMLENGGVLVQKVAEFKIEFEGEGLAGKKMVEGFAERKKAIFKFSKNLTRL